MQIGVLGGTGPAGRGLATRLASAGFDVLIGSRSETRAGEVVAKIKAKWPDRELNLAGASNSVAAGADVVFVATPWDAAALTAGDCSDELAGKVVISMANALTKIGDEFQPLILPRGSVAAAVQAAVPRSLVAATMHHVPAGKLADIANPVESDVLVCSDHSVATEATMSIVSKIDDLRGVDAGGLSNAAAIEAFAAVLLQVNVKYRTRAAIRLTGLPD